MAYFKELAIGGSGGGSVEVISKYSYTGGTTLPNSGSVENIYWNTSLTMEEVSTIIQNANLTYVDFDGLPVYGVYAVFSSDGTPLSLLGIVDATMLIGAPAYAAIDMVTQSMLFCTSGLLAAQFEGMGLFGWNSDLVSKDGNISIVGTLLPSLADMGFGSVGAENDKIAFLVASSPMGKSKSEWITLEGEYDGLAVSMPNNKTIDMKAFINDKKLPLSIELYENGTVIPNDGYVEKIYINTALSTAEVVAILNTIDFGEPIWTDSTSEAYTYYVIQTDSFSPYIVISKIQGKGVVIYYINYRFASADNQSVMFAYANVPTMTNGWVAGSPETIEIYNNVVNTWTDTSDVEDITYNVGFENDKLTRLFSVTPFMSSTIKPDILKNYTVPITGVIPTNTYKGLPINEIILPEGITVISNYAFADCQYLKSINFPSSLTNIHNYAFRNSALVNINIPGTLMALSEYAFEKCTNLSSVYYEGAINDWINLCSTGSPLLRVRAGGARLYLNNELLTHLVVPDGITEVGKQFAGCSSITEITIPNGAQAIKDYAFINCYYLKIVNIPTSLLDIYPGAFQNCDSMETINYAGTKEQWKAITKYGDWDWNTSECVVICTDGTIARDGTET